MLQPVDFNPARRRLSRTPVCLAFAGVLLAGMALPAGAAEVGPLKQITGPSPFSTCTADQVGTQSGTNYPQTEIEPWIDSNPSDPRNMIVGWQQDRWSNGGSRGDVSAYTKNGGATWNTVTLPNVTACTGGPYKRASDPWVSFSPNGVAYYMTLAFDPDLPDAFGPNAMLVSRSTNGGQSWSSPIALVTELAGQVLHDKNSLTADPTNSRYAYAVWDRLRDFQLNPDPTGAAAPAGTAASRGPGAGDGVAAARLRTQQLRFRTAQGNAAALQPNQPAEVFFEGPIAFTRTTNFGRTWEPVRLLYNPGPNAQTINNLIEVLPNGTVIDFFTEILPSAGTRIGMLRSTNHGRTWSGPKYAAAIATVFGIVTPDSQELVRDASILFDTAVDHDNGNVYLVWQDVRFNGVDEVAFSMSTDGARNWSLPVKISKTPQNRNPLRQQVFVPSIEVANGGELVVTYYDFRRDTDDGRERADHWAIFCDPRHENCRSPANWGGERKLTTASFDVLEAPIANGYFLGDYMGLVAAGSKVFPAFGITEGENLTSVYTRPIGRFGGANAPSTASAASN
jgi:hypothetical protein